MSGDVLDTRNIIDVSDHTAVDRLLVLDDGLNGGFDAEKPTTAFTAL